MAYGGSLHFNPLTDTLPLPDGGTFRFSAPQGDIWPEKGYQRVSEYYQAPRQNAFEVQLQLHPNSERLQLIQPFAGWNGKANQEVELLIKVKGKCSEWRSLLSIEGMLIHYANSYGSYLGGGTMVQVSGTFGKYFWQVFWIKRWIIPAHCYLSENLLIGAVNAENDKVNHVRNRLTGNYGTVPSVAKYVQPIPSRNCKVLSVSLTR